MLSVAGGPLATRSIAGVPSAPTLSRRSACAGLALAASCALSLPAPCAAKANSRVALLNELAHLILARKRIELMQAALQPARTSGLQRVFVTSEIKALFKELEFERNMQLALTSMAAVPQARELGRDSLEFLASGVTFDGFDAFSDLTNEGLLARETTAAKLEYLRRAVDRSAASLDGLLALFEPGLVEQARELAAESGIS
jgi:hypothetical protein